MLWARTSELAKWHTYEVGEERARCGMASRPLDWAQAHAEDRAVHGQRRAAPPRGEPVCVVCAERVAFRRRRPKRVHLDAQEVAEALDRIAEQLADLRARVIGED